MTDHGTQLALVAGNGEILDVNRVRPGSRADRMMQPLARQVVNDMAEKLGVCTSPVALRRTDNETGRTELVDVPCGARLAAKCKPCAEKNRRLRQHQIREGWHRSDEPEPPVERTQDDVIGLVNTRAHLEFDKHEALYKDMSKEKDKEGARATEVAAIDAAIAEIDEELTNYRVRGKVTENQDAAPIKRSTKRRKDASKLPRKPIQRKTIGRIYHGRDGKTYQPSTFLTVTLDSHGEVHQVRRRNGKLAPCECGMLHGYRDDLVGTPINPETYDYRQAALDSIHFARVLDRFWQNLRRAAGWQIQYAGAVELQRRLAPHAHYAVRGTMPRQLVREVAKATYHQVWWPAFDEMLYSPANSPEWDEQAAAYVDPKTREPLTTWADAIEATTVVGAQPACVVKLGMTDVKGITEGTKDAERSLRYITKYLTKDLVSITGAKPDADPQQAHFDRLHKELSTLPCSPACANWLLYGVQPKDAKRGLVGGSCKGKVHRRNTLGFTGRRVLISRKWSGKTLTDHKYDRREWVRKVLGGHLDGDNDSQPGRYTFVRAQSDDPDLGSRRRRILRTIAEKQRHKAQLDQRLDELRLLSAAQNGHGEERHE